MKVKGKTNEGTVQEVDTNNVKFFGSEVFRNKDKKGQFKSFYSEAWVKEGSIKVYLNDWKISDLKKHFPFYSSSKRYHTEEKKGKTKKATEWICEVVEEGTVSLNAEDVELVDMANKKKRLFTYKNAEYFYIIDKVFRNNYNNTYYYFDKEGGKLISLRYTVLDGVTKEDLEKAVEEYTGNVYEEKNTNDFTFKEEHK